MGDPAARETRSPTEAERKKGEYGTPKNSYASQIPDLAEMQVGDCVTGLREHVARAGYQWLYRHKCKASVRRDVAGLFVLERIG